MFLNNWSTGFGINLNAQAFDDRATRGGPGAYDNGGRNLWTYLNSDERKAVSFSLNTYNMTDGHGTTFADFSPSVSYRPASFLTVSGGLSRAATTTSRSGSSRTRSAATCSGASTRTPSASPRA